MSSNKEAQYQMFEELKEHLLKIDLRLERLEKQIFEHEDASFRAVLEKYVVGIEFSYGEFQKAQAEIRQSLKTILDTLCE